MEAALVLKAREGDSKAFMAVWGELEGLFHWKRWRDPSGFLSQEDLIAEAQVGLWKGISGCDFSFDGDKLRSYLSSCIFNAVDSVLWHNSKRMGSAGNVGFVPCEDLEVEAAVPCPDVEYEDVETAVLSRLRYKGEGGLELKRMATLMHLRYSFPRMKKQTAVDLMALSMTLISQYLRKIREAFLDVYGA